MGHVVIALVDLPLLLEEAKERPFGGAAYVAGGGRVAFGASALRTAAAGLGITLQPIPAGPLGTEGLFRALGFSAVRVAPENGGLERPEPPEGLAGRFDTVLDFGASQRVFRLPDAFAHLGRLAAPGGRVVHVAPSANHMDAVFYMLSPTMLCDYYRANAWPIERICLLRHVPAEGTAEMLAYEPGLLSAVAHGGLDDAVYRVFCVARRGPDSTAGHVPQQGFYEKAWEVGGAGGHDVSGGASESLKRAIRRSRPAYRALYGLVMPRKKRRIRAACLKPIARYPVASWEGR